MDNENVLAGKGNRKQRRPAIPESLKGLGKVPPKAVELEQIVLGALMLEKDALTAVIDVLHPESFYKENHKEIYKSIVTLFNESEPIDMETVVNQLRKNGTLEFVGGAYYIAELTSRVNSAANIEAHARIIVEQAIKRELISVSSEIQEMAFEDTTDVFELLDKTQGHLFEISEKSIRKSYADMKSIMKNALTELEAKRDQKEGLTGVPTGFSALDRMTSGWQKSDLVIIAARPGMGKTAFVVSAMRNAAVDFGKGVAIFSLEMSAVQLVNRMISAEAELESEKLKKGNLEEYEWEQLVHKTSRLTESPIFIDDTPALSVLELRAKCRRLKSQHDIQLVIIDYLQLMQGDSSSKGNREQEIATISRSLKNLAKELDVPVIALSQLSRAVETRGGDKRPQLSDLRESGSIEQDADMVMFLYRPEYYGITEDEDGMPTTNMGEVIIAKHRNGSLDTVRLKFIGKYTRFTDLDDSGFQNTAGSGGFGSFESSGGGTADGGGAIFGSKINSDFDDELPPPGGGFGYGPGEGNSSGGLDPTEDDSPF
ncbi:replicative DNA helicase [Marinigracilibium pacificum]|uniref:Replicative DNA helicase n=1 Tax=Marinigracilibium pacificum TaxID=2729599 RepID=A0A848J0M3_9BACT|nr:replicative DNA helicase [Marinigracilibium pacificum]NMM48100.1 replicative DNA helicase [Marinigracilibium pacificum]